MKTKEEINKLKEEYNVLQEKLKGLTDEELKEVVGGYDSNNSENGGGIFTQGNFNNQCEFIENSSSDGGVFYRK